MKTLMFFAGLLALPFTPPDGWRQLPTAPLAPELVNWEAGGSTFSVIGIGAGSDPTGIEQMFGAQAAESRGKIVDTSKAPICGRPGVRVVVQSDASQTVMVEQAESIAGKLYVMRYARAQGDVANADIMQFLSTACSLTAIASAKPPLGWSLAGGRLIGVWVAKKPGYSIALISGPPRDETQQTPAGEPRTLCGLPATFATSHATSKTGPSLDITSEHTQSATVAYTLIYTRPLQAADDPKADAALASLCAGDASPQPSP